jgi:hypothetical protein
MIARENYFTLRRACAPEPTYRDMEELSLKNEHTKKIKIQNLHD